MKTIYKAAALAAFSLPSAVAMVSPASAQAVTGIAVFDAERAIADSNAYKAAMQQMQVTYKAQMDAANAKAAAINAELKPMQDAFNAARAVPNANQTTLKTQSDAIQKRGQEGQQEVDKLRAPLVLAGAYVEEQIFDKLEPALDKVMKAKKIAIALLPQTTVKSIPTSNITADVVAELNTTVPSVAIVPPQGWLPLQLRQQMAAQQAQQQGRPAPAAGQAAPPPPPQPQGR